VGYSDDESKIGDLGRRDPVFEQDTLQRRSGAGTGRAEAAGCVVAGVREGRRVFADGEAGNGLRLRGRSALAAGRRAALARGGATITGGGAVAFWGKPAAGNAGDDLQVVEVGVESDGLLGRAGAVRGLRGNVEVVVSRLWRKKGPTKRFVWMF
jgi:hypothetical protein